MIIAILRTSDLELMIDKLSALGIQTRPPADADGNTLRPEERIGSCNSPALTTKAGDIVVTIWLTEDQAELLPEYLDPPEFVCDYLEGVMIEDEEDIIDPETGEVTGTEMVQKPLPWPVYTLTDPGLDDVQVAATGFQV